MTELEMQMAELRMSDDTGDLKDLSVFPRYAMISYFNKKIDNKVIQSLKCGKQYNQPLLKFSFTSPSDRLEKFTHPIWG